MSGTFLGADGIIMDKVELTPALMELTFYQGTQTSIESLHNDFSSVVIKAMTKHRVAGKHSGTLLCQDGEAREGFPGKVRVRG